MKLKKKKNWIKLTESLADYLLRIAELDCSIAELHEFS